MRPFFPHVGIITEIQTVGRSVNRTLRLRAQPRGELTLLGLELAGNVNYTYRRAEDDNDFDNPYVRQWGPTRRDHEVQSQFRVRLPDRVAVEQLEPGHDRSQPRGYGSVVTSPLFGLPTGYTGGRTINLSMSVDF